MVIPALRRNGRRRYSTESSPEFRADGLPAYYAAVYLLNIPSGTAAFFGLPNETDVSLIPVVWFAVSVGALWAGRIRQR